MTLPTGTITMAQVNTELGYASSAYITLNDSAVRALAGKASGIISLNDLRGKSAYDGGVVVTWLYANSSPPYYTYEYINFNTNAVIYYNTSTPFLSGTQSGIDPNGRAYIISGSYRYTRGNPVDEYGDGSGNHWIICEVARTDSTQYPKR